MKLGLIVALGCSLIVGISAACGGGRDRPLTLDGYVQDFNAARQHATAELAYVPASSLNDDNTLTAQERVSVAANYKATLQVGRDFRQLLSQIDPPAVIKDAHTAFIAALDDQLAFRTPFVARYEGAQTVDELRSLGAEIAHSPVEDRVLAACKALEQAARDNSAATPITCE